MSLMYPQMRQIMQGPVKSPHGTRFSLDSVPRRLVVEVYDRDTPNVAR